MKSTHSSTGSRPTLYRYIEKLAARAEDDQTNLLVSSFSIS